MKKNIILLICFLLLATLTYYVINKDASFGSNTEIAVNEKKIAKIFLADMKGNTVTITKKNKQWYLGDQLVRTDLLDNVFKILKGIKAEQPTPDSYLPNVVKSLSTIGTKVELYNNNNNKIETFTIGGTTPDEKGNYILKEGSNVPYIYKTLGYEGDINTIFSPLSEQWRSHIYLQLPSDSIKSISFNFQFAKDSSWEIIRTNANTFNLQNNLKITVPLNVKKVNAYLKLFNEIRCLGFENKLPSKDSIIKYEVQHGTLSIEEINGKKHTIILYYYRADKRTKGQALINNVAYDPDYFFGWDEKDFFVTSSSSLDKIMCTINWWRQ
jgi:hypothetical protein